MTRQLRLTTCLAENSEPLCHHLCGFIEQQLGWNAEFVGNIPWQERAQQLAAGSIHLGWICGLLFKRLQIEQQIPLQLLAAPIMCGEGYKGQPVYFSKVIVRADSEYQTFYQLRGVRWGYNEPGSFSGYAIVRHHLARLGKQMTFLERGLRVALMLTLYKWC